MIRIGVIGLGWWGKQIVTCLAESPRFKVVAGCDIDTKMAAPFAAAHKFDLVDDYKALLKRPDVDAVAVVTPHLLHEEMAIAGLRCRQAGVLRKTAGAHDRECRADSGGLRQSRRRPRHRPRAPLRAGDGRDASAVRERCAWPRAAHGRQCQPQQFPQDGPDELAARPEACAGRRLDRARHSSRRYVRLVRRASRRV